MGDLGYLLYVGFVFMPGVGLGELLQVWRKDDSLMTRLAYSFGLGLAVDTTILAIRTSGLIGGAAGLDLWTIYATSALGLVAFLASVILRKKMTWLVRPTRTDLVVLTILIVQGVLILAYFREYPVFPEYQSPDFVTHVIYAQNILSGTYTSVPAGLLYYGIHFQLASALLLVGGLPLVTVRWTIAILALFSSLLFYLVAQRLFSSNLTAIIVVLVYAISATIWFGVAFNAGLYANLFGILASIFLLTVFLEFDSRGYSVVLWPVLALATISVYFSHYSAVTILPAILLLPFIKYSLTKTFPKRLFLASLLIIIPAVIGALIYPNIVALLQLATSGGGAVNGGTYLSGLLTRIPVLGYMAAEVTYDLGFVILVLLAGIYLWRAFTLRSAIMFIPIVWLTSLLVAAPDSISAWRYSFEALIPLSLMAVSGLSSLLPRIESLRGRTTSRTLYWKAAAILLLVLVPLLAGSWGATLVSDAATNTQTSSQAQVAVNSTITWLKTNTPANASYLSVSDWRFTYTSLMIGRPTTYQYFPDPNQAIQYMVQNNVSYVIVTNLITLGLPDVPQDFPWNNFPNGSNSNLTLIYNNSDVRVYHLA